MANVKSHVRRSSLGTPTMVKHYQRRAPRLTKADLELIDELLSTDEGARYLRTPRLRSKIRRQWDEMEVNR